MTTTITVSAWHNVTRDQAGRHTGLFGSAAGDQMVKVFTYTISPCGRSPEAIAEAAYAAFNNAPHTPEDAGLTRHYYARRLRSLSFPGISPCCSRSCCLRYRPVSQVVVEAAGRADVL